MSKMNIDDEGNEIARDKTKFEIYLDMLKEMSKQFEKLSSGAMMHPVNQYDMESLIVLLVAILQEVQKNTN